MRSSHLRVNIETLHLNYTGQIYKDQQRIVIWSIHWTALENWDYWAQYHLILSLLSQPRLSCISFHFCCFVFVSCHFLIKDGHPKMIDRGLINFFVICWNLSSTIKYVTILYIIQPTCQYSHILYNISTTGIIIIELYDKK